MISSKIFFLEQNVKSVSCLFLPRVNSICFKRFFTNKSDIVLKKNKLLHPEYYEFFNQNYKTDNWTNLTNNIIKYIPIKLYKIQSNPIFFISELIKRYFSDYEVFDFENPIVKVEDNFDSLFIPENHPSRSKSDTYYVNKTHLLRCHTSAHQNHCIERLKKDKFICIADVYRKDVIDCTHFPVFHQCELFHILNETQIPNNLRVINKGEHDYTLEATKLTEQMMKSNIENFFKYILGNDIKMRWIDAEFPFTYPSYELEIFHQNKWVEILGCGIVKKEILENHNINDKIAFAAGFGLERIAMVKYCIPDIRIFWSKDTGILSQFENKNFNEKIEYKKISKYPQSIKDCSFWINSDVDWCDNDFHELARELGGELIEQIKLLDEYTSKEGRKSKCFRIVYRSFERTLLKSEVLELHNKIKQKLVEKYAFEMR